MRRLMTAPTDPQPPAEAAPIFEALAQRDLSQAWLARRIGRPRLSVWRYLNGYRTPPAGFWTAAYERLGLPFVERADAEAGSP